MLFLRPQGDIKYTFYIKRMWHSDEIFVVFRNHLNAPWGSKKGWKWTDFLANTVSCIICICRLMIFSKGDRLGCWSSWIVLSDRIWLTSYTRCINYCCITAEYLEPRWGVLMCKRALRACENNRKACLSWHGWNSQMYAFISFWTGKQKLLCEHWRSAPLMKNHKPFAAVTSSHTSGSAASRSTSGRWNGLRLTDSAGKQT